MSKSVDERVVSMKFDNQQFERNVQTSIGTIDKLKSSLNFDGMVNGVDKVNNAIKNVNVLGLGGAVDEVKDRISAMEVVAVTALANITNSIVNSAKKIIRSLTVEPVGQGFEEYELKMSAVQTIMASTGESIESVNSYLDELNLYADKTIYSFSDMTQSIGKFTNAGVSLEDAVKAIQGISNEAAVSGANTNEASRAMYNFAQALSAGSVKLIDWKSIENANMATVEFKQALIDTAVAMGTVQKEGDKYVSLTTDAKGSTSDAFDATMAFNDSLSSQWMTTDVLVQTLSNYSTDIREMTEEERKAYKQKLRSIGYTEEQITTIEELGKKAFDSAQDVKTFSQLMDTLKEAVGSGWSQTFEILFGNLNEAKILWTAVSKVIGGFIDASSKARNELLQGWKDLGGRQALIESVKNAFESLMGVVEPIKQAFREVFPPMTSENLFKLTEALKEFTSKLKISEQDAENIKMTFKGLFSILDICKEAISALVKTLLPLGSNFGVIGSSILEVTGNMGAWLANLDESIKINDTFNKTIEKVKDTLFNFKDKAIEIFDSVKNHVHGTITVIQDFSNTHFNPPDTSGLEKFSDKVKTILEPLRKFLEKLKNGLIVLLGAFQKGIQKVWELFQKFLPILSSVFKVIIQSFRDFGNAIGDILNGKGFDSLLSLVNGGLLVGIGVGVSEFINNLSSITERAGGLFGGIKSALEDVKNTLASFQDTLKAETLRRIANAIAILVASIFVLALIDPERLSASLAALAGLFVELFGSMRAFNSVLGGNDVKNKTLIQMTSAMTLMSVSVLILSIALKKLASIDSEKLTSGILGITTLIAVLTRSLNSMAHNNGKIESSGLTMILFAVSINILARAVKKLGELDTSNMAKGLAGITLLIYDLTYLITSTKNMASLSAGEGFALIEVATSILILQNVVKKLGELDTKSYAKGLAGITLLIYDLTYLITSTKNMASLSAGEGFALIEIATAILMLQTTVKKLGELDTKSYAKGLAGVTLLIYELSYLMNSTKSATIFSAGNGFALIEIATAILMLQTTVKKLGELDTKSYAKGLAGITLLIYELSYLMNSTKSATIFSAGNGLALIEIAIAILFLQTAVKKLGELDIETYAKGLAGVTLLIYELSYFLNRVGGNLAGFGGLILLAAAIRLLVPAIQELGDMKVSSIIKSLVALAGVFIILGAASVVLAPLAPVVVALGVAVLSLGAGIALLGAGLTMINSAIAVLIASGGLLLKNVIELAPLLVNALVAIGESIIYAINELIPEFVTLGFNILASILEGIEENIEDIVHTVMRICTKFNNAMADRMPEFTDSAARLLLAFIDGLADSVEKYGEKIAEAIDRLMIALLETVIIWFADFGEKGAELVLNLLKGLKDGVIEFLYIAVKAMEDLGNAIIDAFKSILGINSPSTVFKELGGYIVQGCINGIMDAIQLVKDAIKNVANAIIDKFKEILGINSPSTVFSELGGFCIIGLANGIADHLDDVLNIVKDLASKAKDKVEDTVDEWVDSGKNLAKGMADGIADGAEAVADSAKNVGKKAKNSIKKILRINSPSKVTYEFGRYFDEGLAKGIKEYSNLPSKESSIVGENAMNQLRNIMNESIDADYEPVIRPVLDLSDIKSNGKYLSDMFDNSQAMSIYSDIGMSKESSKFDELKSYLGKIGNYDSIIDTINQLHNDISLLSESMKNMQIIMDTGAIAGEMDIQLGAINAYKERWN